MSVCQNSLTDIKVLLDFLKQNDSTPDCEQAQITSLQALSSMCTKQVSELIMQCGGLNLIWKLCGTTKCPEVCQSCLYTLACASESNVHVKLAFSTKGVFSSVKSILKSTDIPDRTRLFAIYFLIPLVTESESGQDLMKSSGCLNTLLEVFISGVQLITCEKFSKKNCKREIWLLSAKALRRSVALPRNETNQLSCIEYIPHTITILHESKGDEEIVLHTCQFFSAVVECNKRCQEKSLSCRALEVLVLSLQSSSTDEKPDKLSGEIVICLNNLLEDQRSYYERFGKLGGIAILLRILDSHNEHLTSHHLSHILMILGRCASHSESCQQQLIKNDAASTIVRLMNNVQTDEYFNKIAASVLNYCMQDSKVSDEGESDESEDDKKDKDDSSSARSSEDEENADPDLNKHQSSPSEKRTELNKDNFDEMFNGGGSCITDIIERQQTQIDLLQALLLQERDKRIENEKTWATIANSNAAMSTRGSSILSPDEPGFRSHHLPLRPSNVRRCPSKSWSVASASNTRHQKVDKRHNEEQKIKSFSDRRTFLADQKNKDSRINNQKILTSTILATPDNPNPPTPHFISPDLNVEKKNLDSTPESNSNKSSRQSMCISSKSGAKVKRHKMNGSQNGSIIDVESFTPKKSEETMMKYYVKEKDKITQRVFKSHTCSTHKQSRSESYLNEAPTNILTKVQRSNEEDDLISVCSEIIQEEINKERKHCRARRCSSVNMNPKELRSMGSSQKVTSSEEDVYSYKESPKAMTFKKPMAPPPRFTHTTRRPRRKFDYQERRNLDEGVRKLGPNFKEILYTYEFHRTRTAMDLRDKYRNMMKL